MTDAERFAKEYLGKVFYFCLKKTGSDDDAEELSSDIACEVISSLSRGASPENFDAWVWTVARRRWAKFAARKYYKTPEQVDIRDYDDILAADDDVERDVILSDDIASLRRELAFIRSDYRKILVSHYVDEMSVSEISKKYDIPVGTVKTRLQSSRKILKEGMNMARTFGVRSYKPEQVGFCTSGNQSSGLPWKVIQRKIPKNILLEASNNPSTIEELAMELGIAVPYMEEEVEILEKSELLKKVDGDKYLTSFFISPRECTNEIIEISCVFSEQNYKDVWALAGKATEKAKELGVLNGTVDESDAQMFFAFNFEQKLEAECVDGNIDSQFKRANGENWGIIGFESGSTCRLPENFFNNSGSGSDAGIHSDGYQSNRKSFGKNLYSGDGVPDISELSVLKALAENGGDLNALSEGEKNSVEYIIKNGYLTQTADGKVIPQMLIFKGDAKKRINEYIFSLPEFKELTSKMKDYFANVRKIVARYSVPDLKDDFDYYVAMSADIRAIIACLWKDKGLYTGGNAQFLGLYY
ncbi:MAG: sigma-70 family RNA polymerase sigma factor [Clostridia bacterium]|nr:sigma-70 family RNA polymerase sigma factor [Clostridia bacterium]